MERVDTFERSAFGLGKLSTFFFPWLAGHGVKDEMIIGNRLLIFDFTSSKHYHSDHYNIILKVFNNCKAECNSNKINTKSPSLSSKSISSTSSTGPKSTLRYWCTKDWSI